MRGVQHHSRPKVADTEVICSLPLSGTAHRDHNAGDNKGRDFFRAMELAEA